MHQLEPSPKVSAEDATLIDSLYRRHAMNMLRYIRRQVNSLEVAEDIVLDAFLAALQSEPFKKLNAHEQEAWLNRVAQNKCYDYHRLGTRKPLVALDAFTSDLYEEESDGPDIVAIRQEEQRVLQERLLLLTDQQRTVLDYKFGLGMSSPEIARRLQKSESAVRMMLARTLTFLRELYYNDDERKKRS